MVEVWISQATKHLNNDIDLSRSYLYLHQGRLEKL